MSEANGNKFDVYSPSSIVFGKSFSEWIMTWSQWWLGQSKAVNPAIDDTGVNCANNQNDPNVFFLVGVVRNSHKNRCIERHCILSGRKAVFFPIIAAIIYSIGKTESELRLRVGSYIHKVRLAEFEATIHKKDDEKNKKNLEFYRIQSNLFRLKGHRRKRHQLWLMAIGLCYILCLVDNTRFISEENKHLIQKRL
jgi:hypothetical protein